MAESDPAIDDLDIIMSFGGDAAHEIPPALFPGEEPSAPEPEEPAVPEAEESAVPELEKSSAPESVVRAAASDTRRRSPRKPRIDAAGVNAELPREKALRLGIEALSDAEVLAILLGSGIPGKPVMELSREILADNDNRLAVLSRQSVPALMKKYKGLGMAKATLLVAAMSFGARAQADMQKQNPQISSSTSAYNYMRSRLERLDNEEFWVMHLSRSNCVKGVEQISKGGQSMTTVDAKLIGKSVMDRLTSGVILFHNHPSGNLNPSPNDDSLTRRIAEVCKLLDVPVLDHIIITPAGYYSYRDNGKI